jgi:transposase
MQALPVKARDYSGENIYVGIDVHDKSWKVHIYSDEFELKSFSQQPDVDGLCDYLNGHYPHANFLLAYESGFSGFWIHRAFKEKGINCRVVHAADVPTNDKEQSRKSDLVDSKKIAKGLKNGDLGFIHVPDIQLELDRQVVRNRSTLGIDSTRVKNRIKAMLKLQGIVVPETICSKHWSQKYLRWLLTVNFPNTSGRLALEHMVDEIQFLDAQRRKIDKSIKSLAESERYKDGVRLLRSIPSVGILSAMILLTELGDITRFKRFDELSSYCGLAPNCQQSGERRQPASLSHRGNAHIKNVLIECAWIMVRKDPAILLYYKAQTKRMKAQKAIIKVTRKLLSRMRHVLMNKTEYVLGVI